MHRDGSSIAEISRKTNVSEPTVRKYVRMGDLSPKVPAKRRAPSMLDDYAPLIDKWLEEDRKNWHKQRHTARRVFERLAAEHSFEGSYSTVQRYVKRCKEEHRESGSQYLDQDWPPWPDAGRLRPGRLQDRRRASPRAQPGLRLPVLQRGPRSGVLRRDRRMRLRGAFGRVRAHKRRAPQDRLRQRDRGRQEGMRSHQHVESVLGLRRPLRVLLRVLQPPRRAREGVGGEQGRSDAPLAVRAGPAVRQRAPAQRAPAGHEHGALGQGPLPQGGKASSRCSRRTASRCPRCRIRGFPR